MDCSCGLPSDESLCQSLPLFAGLNLTFPYQHAPTNQDTLSRFLRPESAAGTTVYSPSKPDPMQLLSGSAPTRPLADRRSWL